MFNCYNEILLVCELLSCVQLFPNPWTIHSPWNSPGQHTRVVAIPFSRDLPNPGIEPGSPALHADALPSEPPGKPLALWTRLIKLPNPTEMVGKRPLAHD